MQREIAFFLPWNILKFSEGFIPKQLFTQNSEEMIGGWELKRDARVSL